LLELALQGPQHVAAGDGLKKFIAAGEARAEGCGSVAIEQTSSIRLVHHSQAVMGTMPLQRKDPPTRSFRCNTTAHEADD
jgi:hypothetical protein